MDNNHFLIGDFSEKSGVSKRMLRHYDKLELLSPSSIDAYNGYRYYSMSQLEEINKIKHLQDFGFTLKTIKDIIDEPLEFSQFVSLLKDQEVKLRNEKDEKIYHLLKLQHFISFVEDNPNLEGNLQLEEFVSEGSLPMNHFDLLKEEIKQLPSAAIFNEKIEDLCEKETLRNITFITYDIDYFAYVNDAFGYDVGDKVIYSVYEIIKRNYKNLLNSNSKNMFSRLGGDEFTLFLVNPEKEKLLEKTQQTLKEIEALDYLSFGCDKTMTSSCGIATFNTYSHPMEFRHHSTKALLEAKRTGRNKVVLLEL